MRDTPPINQKIPIRRIASVGLSSLIISAIFFVISLLLGWWGILFLLISSIFLWIIVRKIYKHEDLGAIFSILAKFWLAIAILLILVYILFPIFVVYMQNSFGIRIPSYCPPPAPPCNGETCFPTLEGVCPNRAILGLISSLLLFHAIQLFLAKQLGTRFIKYWPRLSKR